MSEGPRLGIENSGGGEADEDVLALEGNQRGKMCKNSPDVWAVWTQSVHGLGSQQTYIRRYLGRIDLSGSFQVCGGRMGRDELTQRVGKRAGN